MFVLPDGTPSPPPSPPPPLPIPHPRRLLCRPFLSGRRETEPVGKDVLTSTAVEVHTSANMEHATAVVHTGVRHNMTFAEVAMQGLRKSTEDYMYSHQLPRDVRA